MLVGCRDDFFFRRSPVLVGVAPASMVWFLGRKADDRSGATWSEALQNGTAREDVLADAEPGLQAGCAAVQQRRHKDGQPVWENGRDKFHTTPEARRVLH